VNQNIKKILILGSSGFIGKSLYELLDKQKYDINACNHQVLDATKLNDLKACLEFWKFDYVINCAMSGEGRLLKQDSPECFYNNILIQENLLYLKDYYKKLIVFSSGAQEDRTKDVNNLKEGEFGPPPNNIYSLAKYVNAKRVIGNDKVINIRIFNVFGKYEKDNRFIKSCINKCTNKEDISIWGSKFFDFFYIKDLNTLVEYYIDNPPTKYEEINAVYNDKFTLYQIALLITDLCGKTNIDINEKDINKNYYGSGYKLANLQLRMMGLRNGVDEVYKELKNANI
jgi:nucleoside-diphosphate-sugar epimerase